MSILNNIWDTLTGSTRILKRIELDVGQLKLGQLSLGKNIDDLGEQLGDLGLAVDKLLTLLDPPPAVGVEFEIEVEGKVTEGDNGMELTLTNTQKAIVRIKRFKNAKGGDATVDGIPAWASADETSVVVTASEDGKTVEIKTVGPVSPAGIPTRVTMTADADLGEGVSPIFGTVDVTVKPGQAVEVELEADAPVEQ